MKRYTIFLCSVVIFASTSFKVLSQQADVFKIGSSGDFLRPKYTAGSKVQDIYFDTIWTKTDVVIDKRDKAENVLARYELRANQLEVKTPHGIGVIDAKVIKSYNTVDEFGKQHEFINANEFTIDGVPLKGMIEVLNLGKLSLYKKYSYFIKIPDHNPTLDVGDKSERLFLETHLYYATEKTLMKVPTRKKRILEIFGDKSSQVDSFIEENKLSLTKETALTSVFKYYNSLFN